jgi:hypothetical protein
MENMVEAIASLRFMGDAFFPTVEEICKILDEKKVSE